MNRKKISEEIMNLEEVVTKAEELAATALILYDSYVEGKLSKTEKYYETMIAIIENKTDEVYKDLLERFNRLNSMSKEGEETA